MAKRSKGMITSRCRYIVKDSDGWSFGGAKYEGTKWEAEALAKRVAKLYPERTIFIHQACRAKKRSRSRSAAPFRTYRRKWQCTPKRCTKVRR